MATAGNALQRRKSVNHTAFSGHRCANGHHHLSGLGQETIIWLRVALLAGDLPKRLAVPPEEGKANERRTTGDAGLHRRAGQAR
jgi:hypothetical protein